MANANKGLLIVETMILSGQFGLWILGKPYALGKFVTVRLSVIGNVFLPDVLVGISGFGQSRDSTRVLNSNKETFIQKDM